MRHCLLAVVTLVLSSSPASAGVELDETASEIVDAKLIRPLEAKDGRQSKFSRSWLPPSARRVRVLDNKAQQDSAGRAFVMFAVDARRGWADAKIEENWNKAVITGCVYLETGEVFIERRKAYHPAVAAIGKKTKAAPARTCKATAQLSQR